MRPFFFFFSFFVGVFSPIFYFENQHINHFDVRLARQHKNTRREKRSRVLELHTKLNKRLEMRWRSTNVQSCCPCKPSEPPSSFGRDAWCRSHTAQVGMRELSVMVRTPGSSTGARTRTRADETTRPRPRVIDYRRDQIHFNRSGSSAWSPQALKRVPVRLGFQLVVANMEGPQPESPSAAAAASSATGAVAFWCSEAESCKAGSCGESCCEASRKMARELFVRGIEKIQITSAQPPRRSTPQHPARGGRLPRRPTPQRPTRSEQLPGRPTPQRPTSEQLSRRPPRQFTKDPWQSALAREAILLEALLVEGGGGADAAMPSVCRGRDRR